VAVEESLPPVVGMQSDRMNNILKSVLTGDLIVWISVEDAEECKVITGVVLTKFTFDEVSGTKAILIYCVYGYGNATKESWSSGLKTIQKFAISKGCHRILGYTDVPSIIQFVERIGGETRFRLVSLPLNA
jgi:hypothetical protein